MVARRNVIGLLLALLFGKRTQSEPIGPYCWTGRNKRGVDTYLPCEVVGLTTGTPASKWVDVDLSGFLGIRVTFNGSTQELSATEILTSLGHSSSPERHAKP
jgi:hypothetical protein